MWGFDVQILVICINEASLSGRISNNRPNSYLLKFLWKLNRRVIPPIYRPYLRWYLNILAINLIIITIIIFISPKLWLYHYCYYYENRKRSLFLHRIVCDCAGDCPLPAGRHYNMACVVTLAHQSLRTEAAHKRPHEPGNADWFLLISTFYRGQALQGREGGLIHIKH